MDNAPVVAAPDPPREGTMAPNVAPNLLAYPPGATAYPTPYRPAQVWIPPPPRPASKPAPFRGRELGAALAIALVADLAMWGKSGLASGGYGMALFFTAVPAAIFAAARARRTSMRLAVTTALLLAVAAKSALAPSGGTALSGLALLVLFALGLRARRTFLPEAMVSALSAIGKLPSRIGAAIAGARKITSRTRVGKVSVLPIVVPLALSAVFLGVFALANPIVAHGVDVAWKAIGSVVGVPSPVRVVLWILSLAGACALLRPACRLAQGTESASEEGEASATGLLVARNALAAVNVLFFAYNALDAACLWAGAPPAGMRSQQYAHQGAFWLTVALVMLTGVIGVTFRGALAHDARAKTTRTLAYVWMGQGLVLALGTYRRIAIHIATSGLSDLRIVGILGTTLVVAGVIAVALKLKHRRTLTWLVRRQLDAFALVAVLYAVFPTYYLSARINVARIESGEYRPVLHMFSQSKSTESAGELVPLLHHPDVRVRQGVAALLDAERARLRDATSAQASWRERDVASRRALAALDAAAPEIESTLGSVDKTAARQVLLEISRVANERSLEELLTVPNAESWSADSAGYRNVR
ncbi:MAG: DUF4173 domain-containing protein [Labilithrix sp.]|nr:DUF4173 domain-containing protein [Labilithrix sp.]